MGEKIPVLDIFSGIGAYSLGLERTGGFKTVAFCEIEEYPRRILRKHWPHARIYSDVRDLTGERLRADGVVPRWIVAGWPCQGNSPAGTGLGMDDPRSGLWSEIVRLAGELRPQGLLLENSSNLLNINGGADFGRVLGDLASLGFDAEWHCLPAAAFDAPHIRDRVWIIATANAYSQRTQVPPARRQPAVQIADGPCKEGPPADPDQGQRRDARQALRSGRNAAYDGRSDVSDTPRVRRLARRTEPEGEPRRPVIDGDRASAHAHRLAPVGTAIARQERHAWEPEPDVVRVVHGAPNRVERIHALGNLNPPIIPERIGRAILATLVGRAAA